MHIFGLFLLNLDAFMFLSCFLKFLEFLAELLHLKSFELSVQNPWLIFRQFLKIVNHFRQWGVGAGMRNCIRSVLLLRSGSFCCVWEKGRLGSVNHLFVRHPTLYCVLVVRKTLGSHVDYLFTAWIKFYEDSCSRIICTYVPDYQAPRSIRQQTSYLPPWMSEL